MAVKKANAEKNIAYTDRAVITNTRSWNLHFKSTETDRDVVIPAGAECWSKLTVAEIEGQIQTGNFFFVGADGDVRRVAAASPRNRALRSLIYCLNIIIAARRDLIKNYELRIKNYIQL